MLNIVLLLFSTMLMGAPAWQTGQLVDLSTERVLGERSGFHVSGIEPREPRYVAARRYVIRAGDREYTISEMRYKNAPHVVVNAPIRFRIEKSKVTFLDEDGKEYKSQLERETVVKP